MIAQNYSQHDSDEEVQDLAEQAEETKSAAAAESSKKPVSNLADMWN